MRNNMAATYFAPVNSTNVLDILVGQEKINDRPGSDNCCCRHICSIEQFMVHMLYNLVMHNCNIMIS